MGFIIKLCLNNIIDFTSDLITNSKIHSHNTRKAYKLHLSGLKMNWGTGKIGYWLVRYSTS